MKNLLTKLRQGFTLIEILIVVVIIGILATVAIPTYFKYVQKGYASDAKIQIKNIYMSADMYKQENGEYPSDLSDMEDGYLDLKPSVLEKWGFELDIDESGETGTIVATSTDKMGGGADNVITYDIATGVFTGYGQENEGDAGE
tara:strand:+ start:355 stop:786 length:432 start_codon:yes stop_codon:yes gene_type:complete